MTSRNHGKIYRQIVDMLEFSHLDRRDIISKCVARGGLTEEQLADTSAGGAHSVLRGQIGSVLSEMEARGLVATDRDGLYYLVSARPVVIRIEKCESELISALTERAMTKTELRDRLRSVMGTDKTATLRDDDTLATFMGQILKKLVTLGVINIADGTYILSPKASARADDINEMLTLRSDYIARLHSRGGEFFENYFMNLLSRYMKKHGKRVLECYVTGGSADGGIDGVIKTEDSLGFREVTMVQTKNRTDISSETDVRGFYGAVCARRGTRGIFAATSDLHSGAKEFLDALDDCVYVNGERLFRMAVECGYGIKKSGGKLIVDTKLI